MRYTFGDIVIVDFPFSDWSRSKRRPALVLAHDAEDDVVVARVTSKPRESELDATMQDWKQSKLLFPSTICLGKLATLSLSLVEKKSGELSARDRAAALKALHAFVESLESR
jgi:mRNA interferase MazF